MTRSGSVIGGVHTMAHTSDEDEDDMQVASGKKDVMRWRQCGCIRW